MNTQAPEPPQMNYPESQPFTQKHKNLLKGILISVLILVLMIPTFFISNLIDERKVRNEEVKQEVANQWSQPQTLTGPVLMIPFLETTFNEKRQPVVTKHYAYFMPDKLNVNGTLDPKIKSRSIFKVPVYNSTIQISGSFGPLNLKTLNLLPENLIWKEARLVIGITDFKGLQEQTEIAWNQEKLLLNVGDDYGVCNDEQALSAELVLDPEAVNKTFNFSSTLHLRGSEKIFFTPNGTTTKVDIKANWLTRDFKGNYLPDSHKLTDSGFTANWNVYRATQPQQKYKLADLARTTFGVNLMQPLDNYAKTTRTIKYAILVIMLTFVVYFFIEVFQKKNVHAIQYVLIGFALCIFYTLVLSLSEYTSFQLAYLLSALATVLLIALYTKSTFNSTRTAMLFGGFLTMLYTFIFILIQLEDGALLVGSIGLFIILASIMYFSRKLDWNK